MCKVKKGEEEEENVFGWHAMDRKQFDRIVLKMIGQLPCGNAMAIQHEI